MPPPMQMQMLAIVLSAGSLALMFWAIEMAVKEWKK